MWRLVSWGRTVIGLYGIEDTYGGAAHNNMGVFEAGYHILRRSAGVIEPLKRKLRSMEDVWLDSPVAEPKIAVLKPSVSQICAWPTGGHPDAVLRVCHNIHSLLYGRNYHYAFVPEEYVLSGRDDLSGYSVVVLPYATHFPPGLAGKLLAWVESGGTLIAAGVAGEFTPYGKHDGALMAAVFGKIGAMPWGDLLWNLDATHLRPEVKTLGPDYPGILLADHGKGRVLMAASAKDLGPGGPAAETFYQLVDAAAPRGAWAEGDPVGMNVRRGDGVMHVTLYNPNIKKPARATIHLAGPHAIAIDRGIEGGMPVPLRKEAAGRAFDIRLAPGEGTVVQVAGPR